MSDNKIKIFINKNKIKKDRPAGNRFILFFKNISRFLHQNKWRIFANMLIVALFLLSSLSFYSQQAHALLKKCYVDDLLSANNGSQTMQGSIFTTKKNKVVLGEENISTEDFNAKIKDVDFEALIFEKSIPILMYHYIEPENPTQSKMRRDLSVTPESFEQQMKWLYDNDYTSITMSKYFSMIADNEEIPQKTVLITMDDGYKDFFTYATPIMNRYNQKATEFLITDSIGYPAYLDWDQIKILSAQGFEFGSHTLTHPNLKNLKDDALKNELVKSKADIEKQLGKAVNFFCYPSGAYNDKVEQAVKAAGYRGATTTANGYRLSNKNMFEMTRFRIPHTMSMDGFIWTIESAQPKSLLNADTIKKDQVL